MRLNDQLYLVPSDAYADDDPDALISLAKVNQWLSASQAKIKIVILDACNTGPSLSDLKHPATNWSEKFLAEYIGKSQGVATLASSLADQPSSTKSPHPDLSLFTNFVVNGLNGEAEALDDGFLTVESLFKYVSTYVQRVSKSHHRDQQPAMKISSSGMIVLGDYRHREESGAAPVGLVVPANSEAEFVPKDASKRVLPTTAEEKKVELARFETLRKQLVDAVVNGPPVKLDEGPLIVLHLVPTIALDGPARVDLQAAKKRVASEMSPLGASSWSWAYDVDSLTAVHALPEDVLHFTFTRLFETGALQLVVAADEVLNSVAYRAPRALETMAPALEKLGLQGSCFVSLDILHSKSATISTKGQLWLLPHVKGRPIAHERLSPAAVAVESSRLADPAAVLRPALDYMIWRAAGFEKCWSFDDNGKLLPP